MFFSKRLIFLLSVFIMTSGLNLYAQTSRDCSFLIDQLAKYPSLDSSLSDLDGKSPSYLDAFDPVWADSSIEKKLEALRYFPIAQVTTAPGHRFLRNPDQVKNLVDSIKGQQGGDFHHDPLLFNLITKSNGQIISVDLWNAHHRLVAYLEAGYKTLGQIPLRNFEILVNGQTQRGEFWTHYLSVAGFQSENFYNETLAPSAFVRLGTVAVSGAVSNLELGSRTTIQQLHYNTFLHHQPRVGLYFGTFDPIHEGHIQIAKQALKEFHLDEVLIVPNWTSIEKPDATEPKLRVALVSERIKDEEKINLYIGDSSVIVDRFSRIPFIERVTQIYGTSVIFQIIGEDRYLNLISRGIISSQESQRYLVFPRENSASTIPVDNSLKKNVLVSQSIDTLQASSTKIRDALQNGQSPPPEQLHPRVLKLIQDNRIYDPASPNTNKSK